MSDLNSSVISSLSKKDIKRLALGIFLRKVFTDRHLCDKQELMASVFLPLGWMSKSDEARIRMLNPSMIYEWMSWETKTSEDGYPAFPTFQMLNQQDATFVYAHLRVLNEKVGNSKMKLKLWQLGLIR